MKIWVKRIPEEGETFEGTKPSELLGLENDAAIKNPGELHYSLHAQPVSKELVVRGELSVALDLQCTRCAEFFSTTVTDSDFLRAYPTSQEIDAVDIAEDMREDLLLNLPGFPVCSNECKGLCVECGMDLNKGSCNCQKGVKPSAWQALDNLDL